MPQALVPIFTALGASAGVATVAAYAVTLVGTLALSNSQKRKAERQQRAQYQASVVDRMENSQSTVEPRKLVLGRTRVGGAAFYQTSVAPYNAVFVSVLALAGHEIDGVERIFFNETPVELDGDGNVTTAPWGRYNKLTVKETDGNPVRTLEHTPLPGTLSVLWVSDSEASSPFTFPNGASNVEYTLVGNTLSITDPQPGALYTITYQWQQFISTARVFVHLGSPDQAADARMQALLPGTWTAEHRARGVAYLECEFVYEDTSFPTGLPNVTAQIRGAKCYDPRTGNTAFTENPAVMMRHVLTHPQFGKRPNITAAEETRIIAQANACDIPISYFGTDLVPMYRAAMVVPFGAAPRDVLDDLAQAMGGEWAYAAGQFYSRAGVYQAPVMNLTDADLAVVQRGGDGAVSQTPIGLSPHKPRAEKINTVVARIWNQDENYLEVPLMPFRAAALVDDDGAELPQEVVMPAVFYGGQAFHICGIMLRDARDPLTVTLPFKLRAYPLELFDSVTLTLAKYGWVNKEFRILNRTFQPSGYVMLTLKETTATIFQYGAGYLPGGSAPNSGLPKPWDIYPPAFTSITSGEGELIVQSDGTVVNSIRVQWLPVQEASIVSGGNVEVQFLVLPNGDWRSVIVPGDATEARLTGVDDLAVVLIRARTTNSLASSVWGTQFTHQVIGKTEPPPNIENLSIAGSVLSWRLPRRVPDLAGFVFRFHYGNNLDWGSAAPLHTGLVTASPWEPEMRPGGLVTIMGKAQDTSGNQSLASANIVMNLGDPPIANVLEQWDFRALGWPIAPDGGMLAPGRYPQYNPASIYSSSRSTTATFISGGVIQTAAVDVPRFESGALLIEGEATNFLRYSQNLAGASWAGACSVSAAAESYLGIPFTSIAKTTTGGSEQKGQNFGAVSAGQTRVATVVLLAGTKSSAMIGLYSAASTWGTPGSGSAQIVEGPGALSPYSSGTGSAFNVTGLSATIPTVLRIVRTYAEASTGSLYIYPGSANPAPIGDSMKVAFAQVEEGATPTSYIPTTTLAVTRAADIVYVSEGQYGYERSGGDLVADALDSFYGTDDQSFYGGAAEPFYGLGNYSQLIYVTPEISVSSGLAGSVMTVEAQAQGIDLRIEYRLAAPGSFYGPDSASFYEGDSTPFYGPPGEWMPWPGQLVAARDAYQFRVTVGAGSTQAILQGLVLTIDAPDMQEVLADLVIAAGGTVIPYIKPFTSIKAITTTLQANGSGAVTTETDKTNPLAPKIRAFNAAHTSVGGATADIVIQGY